MTSKNQTPAWRVRRAEQLAEKARAKRGGKVVSLADKRAAMTEIAAKGGGQEAERAEAIAACDKLVEKCVAAQKKATGARVLMLMGVEAEVRRIIGMLETVDLAKSSPTVPL